MKKLMSFVLIAGIVTASMNLVAIQPNNEPKKTATTIKKISLAAIGETASILGLGLFTTLSALLVKNTKGNYARLFTTRCAFITVPTIYLHYKCYKK